MFVSVFSAKILKQLVSSNVDWPSHWPKAVFIQLGLIIYIEKHFCKFFRNWSYNYFTICYTLFVQLGCAIFVELELYTIFTNHSYKICMTNHLNINQLYNICTTNLYNICGKIFVQNLYISIVQNLYEWVLQNLYN